MKQFKTIFQFELMNYFKNKVFVGVTVFLVAAIAVVMFLPRIFSDTDEGGVEIGTGDANVEASSETDGMLLLFVKDEKIAAGIHQAFQEAFPSYEVELSQEDVDSVKKKVESGMAECAFAIDSFSHYTYYVENLSMYDVNTEIADEVLKNISMINAMGEKGIPAEEAGTILAASIEHETESIGKDQAKNFFYTYIMIFALYMVILLYGQMVATNVATEKSSRAMELLITSAKPVSMMFGKVIASCLAGFLQLLIVFGSSILFYNLNDSYWEGNYIVASIFDMPPELLVYMLIFFVLGFFVYAFLFGAIGSTASKVEDINTSVMPLTLLFIAGFLVVMISMSSGSVDSLLMRICSYVPFTSPMAMFTRIAMSTVPFYEIALSILILIASVAAIGVISAKIYRVGILLYGTTPKIGSILKAIKKA